MTSSKQKHIKAYRKKKKSFCLTNSNLIKKKDSDKHSSVTYRDARIHIPDCFI